MQRLLIRDLQLHTAVDDIAFQPIQADDFLIAATVAEIFLGNRPEGVAMHHGVDAVILCGFCANYGECGNLDGRHDGISAALVPVDDRTVTAGFIDIPTQLLHPGRDGFPTIIGATRDGHEVTGLDTYRCGLDWLGRLYITVTFSARSPILAYIQLPGQLLAANHLWTVSTISSDFGV